MLQSWSRSPTRRGPPWRGPLALAPAAAVLLAIVLLTGGCRSRAGPSGPLPALSSGQSLSDSYGFPGGGARPPVPCPVLEVSVAWAGRGAAGGIAGRAPGGASGRAVFEPLAVDPPARELVAPPGWRPPGRLRALVLRREEVLGVGLPVLAEPVLRLPCLLAWGPGPGRGRPQVRLVGVSRAGAATLACGPERFSLAPGAGWARAWCLAPGDPGPAREIRPGPGWRPQIEAAWQAGYGLVRVEVRNLGLWRVDAAGDGAAQASSGGDGGW